MTSLRLTINSGIKVLFLEIIKESRVILLILPNLTEQGIDCHETTIAIITVTVQRILGDNAAHRLGVEDTVRKLNYSVISLDQMCRDQLLLAGHSDQNHNPNCCNRTLVSLGSSHIFLDSNQSGKLARIHILVGK